MSEQVCDVGRGIELCYETFGDPADPTALLIMGLGMQMVAWPRDFCLALAHRGLHVVRFDNRDAGRSTHVAGRGPALHQLLLRSRARALYTLADMADDCSGLLRELDLAPAHVIGTSMGGMIAQTLAIRHPDQVSSLTSIMASTGHRRVGQPALGIYPMLMRRAPSDREALLEHSVRVFRVIGSPALGVDEQELRALAARSYERNRDPEATRRQLAAILASPDRTRQLRSLKVPTLVIHGSADRLVRPSGGHATARAIPGARLLQIDGMGHDLPRTLWPRMIDAIIANSARGPVVVIDEPRTANLAALYRGGPQRQRRTRSWTALQPAIRRLIESRARPGQAQSQPWDRAPRPVQTQPRPRR